MSLRQRSLQGVEFVVGDERLFQVAGRSRQMVQAMIDSVDHSPAPKRLLLGSDAYDRVHRALTERLANLDAQRETAISTDAAA